MKWSYFSRYIQLVVLCGLSQVGQLSAQTSLSRRAMTYAQSAGKRIGKGIGSGITYAKEERKYVSEGIQALWKSIQGQPLTPEEKKRIDHLKKIGKYTAATAAILAILTGTPWAIKRMRKEKPITPAPAPTPVPAPTPPAPAPTPPPAPAPAPAPTLTPEQAAKAILKLNNEIRDLEKKLEKIPESSSSYENSKEQLQKLREQVQEIQRNQPGRIPAPPPPSKVEYLSAEELIAHKKWEEEHKKRTPSEKKASKEEPEEELTEEEKQALEKAKR